MWTVYALAVASRFGHSVVKIGCTESVNVDARLANYLGRRIRSNQFLSDEDLEMVGLLAQTTDESSIMVKYRNITKPASSIEQEVLNIMSDLDLLCPDEFEYGQEGYSEIFYADLESWPTVWTNINRLDVTSETRDFVKSIFVAIYGEEEIENELNKIEGDDELDEGQDGIDQEDEGG